MLIFSMSGFMLEALNGWFQIFIKDYKVNETVFMFQMWKMRFKVVKNMSN